MEQFFQALEEAIAEKNQVATLATSANLQRLLWQHNVKEEQILYPMADQILSNKDAMVTRMTSFNTEPFHGANTQARSARPDTAL